MKAICENCEREYNLKDLDTSEVQRFCPNCGRHLFELWDV